MAPAAERLQVRRVEALFGREPHRLDMIDLEPPLPGLAGTAPPAIPLEDGHAQHLPAAGCRDALGMAPIGLHHAHASTAFRAGAACMRAPCAIASTAAAAASIRPRERALASFALPAGSISVIASANAKRSNSDGATFTSPSNSARRKQIGRAHV